MIRAVRGAISLDDDTADAMEESVAALMATLAEKNAITEDHVVSVFFTVTPDIHSLSPARAARVAMGWHRTAMMCAVEPVIEGLPPLCVRVLIQFETALSPEAIQPVYLKAARSLRPDLIR